MLSLLIQEYRKGTLLSGQLKAMCIQKLQEEVAAFQAVSPSLQRRILANDGLTSSFYTLAEESTCHGRDLEGLHGFEAFDRPYSWSLGFVAWPRGCVHSFHVACTTYYDFLRCRVLLVPYLCLVICLVSFLYLSPLHAQLLIPVCCCCCFQHPDLDSLTPSALAGRI